MISELVQLQDEFTDLVARLEDAVDALEPCLSLGVQEAFFSARDASERLERAIKDIKAIGAPAKPKAIRCRVRLMTIEGLGPLRWLSDEGYRVSARRSTRFESKAAARRAMALFRARGGEGKAEFIPV